MTALRWLGVGFAVLAAQLALAVGIGWLLRRQAVVPDRLDRPGISVRLVLGPGDYMDGDGNVHDDTGRVIWRQLDDHAVLVTGAQEARHNGVYERRFDADTRWTPPKVEYPWTDAHRSGLACDDDGEPWTPFRLQ